MDELRIDRPKVYQDIVTTIEFRQKMLDVTNYIKGRNEKVD